MDANDKYPEDYLMLAVADAIKIEGKEESLGSRKATFIQNEGNSIKENLGNCSLQFESRNTFLRNLETRSGDSSREDSCKGNERIQDPVIAPTLKKIDNEFLMLKHKVQLLEDVCTDLTDGMNAEEELLQIAHVKEAVEGQENAYASFCFHSKTSLTREEIVHIKNILKPLDIYKKDLYSIFERLLKISSVIIAKTDKDMKDITQKLQEFKELCC